MSELTAPAASAPTSTGAPVGGNLRLRGLILLILVLVEVIVGDLLARAGSPYPLAALVGHIVLAVLVSGAAVGALIAARRHRSALVRAGTVVAVVGGIGATLAGTWFLLGGMPDAALGAMEGLAGLTLVGAALLIVGGGPAAAPPSPPA